MLINNNVIKSAALPERSQEQNQAVSQLKENNFGTFLNHAINEINSAQVQSDEATQKFLNGQNIELHDVMISAQKAAITMQAALEIRNKAVEAYQEMMRMQI
ncbi:flagellar hook-basal body complex protein FliE [Lederbergia ruris]|uniref:Flagellar hook-basal body complex protein FliE n=1 Tax=Lederbergia ruris TaxID=217495 RepID=A0ABQ4KIP0_9BACI|nr:flagellar hook-basal body complex protein FliE [Lederbergia ruris]GIN57833.1 flagellar hook-basal body complex protein FliE [Lederbergia ruris]